MMCKPTPEADWRKQGIALFAGRFLVRPSAHLDESFLGYRLRVASANGLSNPSWLDCVDTTLPKANGIARWCPLCLAEPYCYWREAWYSGNAACFRHQSWLASTCGTCRRMLRWKQVRLATCICGAQLYNDNIDAFSADLQNLLSAPYDSSVGAQSIEERWSLARLLGALSQYGLLGKPLKKASRQTTCVERLLVSDGAALIVDRTGCFNLLDRLRVPHPNAGNLPLLSEVFPRLLSMLRKQLSEAACAWMLDLLDAYVAYSSQHGVPILWERKGVSVGGAQPCRPKTRSSTIASMLSQTGSAVPTRQTGAGRRKFLISYADLENMRNKQRLLLRLKTAARYAGMSVERIRALAKANLIVASGSSIDRNSIARLLGSIAEASIRSVQELDDPIGFSEALRLYVPVDASARFFSQIASGVVRLAVEPNEIPTLRNILVARQDVVSLMRVSAQLGTQISIVEAACRLGIKQEVMYHLINIGLVRTLICKLGRRAARVVEVDELRNFAEQFLPLFTLAKATGISAREAPDWAKQHGIEIVTGPSVDGGRQYWIRRPREMNGS